MPSSAFASSRTVCLVGGVMSGLRLQGEKAAAQTPNQGGGLYMSLESSIVIELDAPVKDQKSRPRSPHSRPNGSGWSRLKHRTANAPICRKR